MKHTIGHRIRKIRQSKDLSQENVADELGITKGAYSKIETGHTDPSIGRVYKIAEILNIEVSEFFMDTKKMEDPDNKYGFATKSEVEELAEVIRTLSEEMKKIKEALDKKSK